MFKTKYVLSMLKSQSLFVKENFTDMLNFTSRIMEGFNDYEMVVIDADENSNETLFAEKSGGNSFTITNIDGVLANSKYTVTFSEKRINLSNDKMSVLLDIDKGIVPFMQDKPEEVFDIVSSFISTLIIFEGQIN